jgi:hypothetical protein
MAALRAEVAPAHAQTLRPIRAATPAVFPPAQDLRFGSAKNVKRWATGGVVNDVQGHSTITVGRQRHGVRGANDTIIVGNGNDTVTAGPGSTITLGSGADTVTAISSLINGA